MEGLFGIREDDKLLKAQSFKLLALGGGRGHFSANYRCKSDALANKVTVNLYAIPSINKQIDRNVCVNECKTKNDPNAMHICNLFPQTQ